MLSSSSVSPATISSLFDDLYNAVVQTNIPLIQELLKQTSFEILDKTNRTLISKLAAENQEEAITFLLQHKFDISLEQLVSGYAEANQEAKIQEILDKTNRALISKLGAEDQAVAITFLHENFEISLAPLEPASSYTEASHETKIQEILQEIFNHNFELMCAAMHGYARAKNISEVNKYYALAIKSAQTDKQKSRVNMLRTRGFALGNHFDEANASAYSEIRDIQFESIKEIVFAMALLGNKKLNKTIEDGINKESSAGNIVNQRSQLQRKAILGFAQGGHLGLITRLLKNISQMSQSKLWQVAAFGHSKGNNFDNAISILSKMENESDRCLILENIVVGLGVGGLKGKALSVIDFANTVAERKITLRNLALLYRFDLVSTIKESILPLARDVEEIKVVLEILFTHYYQGNDSSKAQELFIHIAPTDTDKIYFGEQIIEFISLLTHKSDEDFRVILLKEILLACLQTNQVKKARELYLSMNTNERNVVDTSLIPLLSKMGAISFLCEILSAQKDLMILSMLYWKIDPQLYNSPLFATRNSALQALAGIKDKLLRNLIAANLEKVKQHNDFLELSPKADELNKLMTKDIITNSIEAETWLSLSPAKLNDMEYFWNKKIINTFTETLAWMELHPGVRTFLFQVNPLRKDIHTSIWFKVSEYLTPVATEKKPLPMFQDIISYSLARSFFNTLKPKPPILLPEPKELPKKATFSL